MVLLAQPVLTGLLSIPLLGESLAVRQVLGGALVLTGIALCLRRTTKDEGLTDECMMGQPADGQTDR